MASPEKPPSSERPPKSSTHNPCNGPSVQNGYGDTLKPVINGGREEWSVDSSSEEDYDKLRHDPDDMLGKAHGGGIEKDGLQRRSGSANQEIKSASTGKPRPVRRKSIQVVLETTNTEGRYKITADDPEIREILRNALERGVSDSDPAEKKKRLRFRDLMFTKQFTTFDRQNPLSAESPFHGFFTLFWLCLGMLLLRVAAYNWRTHGSVFGGAELLHMMFGRDVILLGLTDGAMTLFTAFGLVLQLIIVKGWLSWNRSGWIIQNLWQTFYLGACIGWTFYREWPWTHTIFVTLHSLVFLMKQHSYAFYNGYLSQVYQRRKLLEQKLSQLDDIVPTPSSPEISRAATALEQSSRPEDGKLRRRGSLGPKASTNLIKEKSGITTIASALESGEALDKDQLSTFSTLLRNEIAILNDELSARCTDKAHAYPKNLTIANFADWTVLPTLVYELEYPRQERINWIYVAEKTAATFGCLWIMMVISQAYIYPSVLETLRMKEAGMSIQQRAVEFPWILSDLLFPMLLEQLLTWYVIWECILNVLAEVTRFADRGFYGDWWNSVSWDQYARDWNRPVHNFLLRHVYHSSISAFHLSKPMAMFATFFLSACVHELVMFALFHKVRGYLFMFQLLQIPLAAMSRTKLLKGRSTIGNLMFWIGLFVGPSLITSLYLIV